MRLRVLRPVAMEYSKILMVPTSARVRNARGMGIANSLAGHEPRTGLQCNRAEPTRGDFDDCIHYGSSTR
jgi:hypothetical protein